jgi:glycosyltransferase involved in cell wall biosynthesis
MVGQPDDEALWRLYEECDVLVAASQHEGLCMPVIEAYHAGCRVIGSDAGNLPFIVQPPDPLFPVNDSSALAVSIERIAREVLAGTRVERGSVGGLLDRYSAATTRDRLRRAIDALTPRLSAATAR